MKTFDFQFQKQRGFGEVINASLTFLVHNFLAIIKYLVTFSLPFIVAGLLIIGSSFVNLFMNPDFFMYNSFGGFFFIRMIVAYLLFLVGAIFMINTILAYARVFNEEGRENITRAKVWSIAKRRFFPVLGFLFLMGIAGFLVSLIFGLIVAAIQSLILNFIFMLLFGFLFGAIMFYAAPNIVLEDVSAPDAISRSFDMVKGNFWFTVGLMIIMMIIIYIIALASSLPIFLLTYLNSLIDTPLILAQIFSIVFFALYFIVILLGSVVFTILQSVQFYNVIEKREQTSLKDKIDSINTPDEENPS
jgi:hypothetical protein